MTPLEFHYDFEVLADEIEALANKSFNPAEKDWLLNRSQDQIVRSFLNMNNVRKAGFEMDQKRIDDLKGIMVKYPEQPKLNPIQVEAGLYELPLSTLRYEYLHFIRGSVITKQDNCSVSAKLILVQHSDLSDSLTNPFTKPSNKEVIINFGRASNDSNSQSIYLYSDIDIELNNLSIEYLKKPNRIYLGTYNSMTGQPLPQSNTDLSESLHPQIVSRAVQLAAGIMKDQNLYQVMTNEIATEE